MESAFAICDAGAVAELVVRARLVVALPAGLPGVVAGAPVGPELGAGLQAVPLDLLQHRALLQVARVGATVHGRPRPPAWTVAALADHVSRVLRVRAPVQVR